MNVDDFNNNTYNTYEDDIINYTPPTAIDDSMVTATLVSIKDNPILKPQATQSNQNLVMNSTSAIESLRDDEDVFKGKFYTNISNGVSTQVVRTVRIKGNYYVILNTGEQIAVNEFNRLYIESIGIGHEMDDSIVPNSYYNNTKVEKKEVVEINPVKVILEKLKEKTDKLSIDLELKLPPKGIYDVLIDSYDNAEDDIINYIFSGNTIDNIKNAVKEKLKEYYAK